MVSIGFMHANWYSPMDWIFLHSLTIYYNYYSELTINATGNVTTLENIGSIKAYNSLIGTRSFIESAPFAFSGPGMSP